MKNQRKRLLLCVAMVLLIATILPILGGCGEEAAPTTTAEEAVKEVETDEVPTTSKTTPVVTQSNPNAESLQSTPNKGGNKQVTSGTTSVKSKYSASVEAMLGELAGEEEAKLATVAQRRDYAEAYMRAMLSVEWTLDEREGYSIKSDGKTIIESDYETKAEFEAAAVAPDDYTYKISSQVYNMKSGRVYRGIPYTNGASGLETFYCFLDKVDDKGVAHMDLDVIQLYGGAGAARVGAMEFTALMYAWNTVSSTAVGRYSYDAVPTNGFYPVGDYEFPELTEEERKDTVTEVPLDNGVLVGGSVADRLTVVHDGSLEADTDDVVALNGEQKMYAAYAKIQKADGLIRSDDSTDDAMMAVSVQVEKKSDGTIDGEKSYVTVHYQTDANFLEEVVVDGVYIIGDIDKKISFKELFDSNYIPMTVAELMDGSAPASQIVCRDANTDEAYQIGKYMYTATVSSSNIGKVTSTRRILWANAILTDSNGNMVYDNISFAELTDCVPGAEKRFIFDLSKIDDSHDQNVGLGDDIVPYTELPAGKYHFQVKVKLISGEEVDVRDWTFEIKICPQCETRNDIAAKTCGGKTEDGYPCPQKFEVAD